MHAVYLSHDMDANAEQIVSFLEGFEEKYPKQPEAFETVARTRLVALQKTGRYTELARDVDTILERYQPDKQEELLAGLSGVLEKDIRKLRRQDDKDSELIAKRTLTRLHEAWLKNDGEFAEDQSPDRFHYDLAQLYLDTQQYDKAELIYKDLEQKQGAYALVAIVGWPRSLRCEGIKNGRLLCGRPCSRGPRLVTRCGFAGRLKWPG